MLLATILWGSLYNQSQKPFDITLDGRVDSLEWKKATSYPLQHSGEVKIMSDQNYIYVAVKGGSRGWSHVYAKRGATVRVLHASAALGTAVYEAQKKIMGGNPIIPVGTARYKSLRERLEQSHRVFEEKRLGGYTHDDECKRTGVYYFSCIV